MEGEDWYELDVFYTGHRKRRRECFVTPPPTPHNAEGGGGVYWNQVVRPSVCPPVLLHLECRRISRKKKKKKLFIYLLTKDEINVPIALSAFRDKGLYVIVIQL